MTKIADSDLLKLPNLILLKSLCHKVKILGFLTLSNVECFCFSKIKIQEPQNDQIGNYTSDTFDFT